MPVSTSDPKLHSPQLSGGPQGVSSVRPSKGLNLVNEKLFDYKKLETGKLSGYVSDKNAE